MLKRIGPRGGLVALGAVVLVACSVVRPDQIVHVASGMNSRILCSETFITGLPTDKVYADVMQAQVGFNLVDPLLNYRVDRGQHEVATRIAGLFSSRAVYREGWGCTLARGERLDSTPFPADVLAERKNGVARLPDIAGPAVVAPRSEALRAALDKAFAEPAQEPFNLTRAVVVVHAGKVVAERYAPGYGVDTPLHGWSMTKSVFNALTGVMAQQGRIGLDEANLFPAWREPGDPRHAVTVRQLLRQTSGLGVTQTDTGFDPASRMKFIEGDMAGYAQAQPLVSEPGSRWAYSDGNFVLLSRLLQDKLGGGPAAFARFAQKELFTPLGMRGVTLEVDTTGTPIGSAFMFAPARDWARLGLLFLGDGVVGGTRLLPAGWVRDSTAPTPGTGYGAGFFTNRLKGGEISNWGIRWDLPLVPDDAYFARGFMGQYMIVVPSEQLVVVRMGPSHVWGGSLESTGQLVADVMAALHPKGLAVAAAAQAK